MKWTHLRFYEVSPKGMAAQVRGIDTAPDSKRNLGDIVEGKEEFLGILWNFWDHKFFLKHS